MTHIYLHTAVLCQLKCEMQLRRLCQRVIHPSMLVSTTLNVNISLVVITFNTNSVTAIINLFLELALFICLSLVKTSHTIQTEMEEAGR